MPVPGRLLAVPLQWIFVSRVELVLMQCMERNRVQIVPRVRGVPWMLLNHVFLAVLEHGRRLKEPVPRQFASIATPVHGLLSMVHHLVSCVYLGRGPPRLALLK